MRILARRDTFGFLGVGVLSHSHCGVIFMGQEIERTHFSKQDFARFDAALRSETALLGEWLEEGRFHSALPVAGLELEACIVDSDGFAAPWNTGLLEALDNDWVVPELARFNVELNAPPLTLQADALRRLHGDLANTWSACLKAARSMDGSLMTIGILPTLRERELSLENMSDRRRYRALNEQVLRLRNGQPIRIDIEGRQHLRTEHQDVMLESATTSFQVHLQMDQDEAVRLYNAALCASAPVVALAANSPYLFGMDLWDETRIPLFEQAVATHRGPQRVTLGAGYLRESVFECFRDNLERFPTLLPMTLGDDPATLDHLRLHNGTIWRWNRPLLEVGASQEPTLRLEHRVIPAGPTIVDMVANAAFFYGLVFALGRGPTPPEHLLAFERVRDNFYRAARLGLTAHIDWLDGRRVPVRDLLLEILLPTARYGLEALEMDRTDIDRYLGLCRARVMSGQTGAAWQRAFVNRHRASMAQLTLAYAERQDSGKPVHEWTL